MRGALTVATLGILCTLALSAESLAAKAEGRFSYAGYNQVLKTYVIKGGVDYAMMKEDRSPLDRFVESMGKVSEETYRTWDEAAQLAFWINAYNAITLKVIIDHYPIRKRLLPSGLVFPRNSIQQIPGKWAKITHTILGKSMTLDQIEHKILRKKFQEPRIHVALVCAARGCPSLRSEAYVGERLNEQLDDQTRRFLNHPAKFRINLGERVVELSSIFKWFGRDFLKVYGPQEGFQGRSEAERAVLAFISRYLDRNDREFLEQGEYRVAYLKYDWTLNDTPAFSQASGK